MSFARGQNSDPSQRTHLFNNKEDRLVNRSSLVFDGTNSRFYSPLYEHWHHYVDVVFRVSRAKDSRTG